MKVKGVNLGNWLVLEKWMSSELFYGLDAEDEEAFYSVLSQEEAQVRLRMHRDYFIQERDFHHIKTLGMNMVRIPVPHYIFGDKKPYIGCIEYLDKAFLWAEKYGLKILVDLHTVPNSQNGFDNGGLTGIVKWHLKQENINTTLEVLEALAVRYANQESLYGIELLNEPISEKMWEFTKHRYVAKDLNDAKGSFYVPTEVLKDFYIKGYECIRKHCDERIAVVLHDGFRLEEWESFMPKAQYKNVVFDTHLYLGFYEGDMKSQTMEDYKKLVEETFSKRLEQASKYHDVIVGEWCIANKYPALTQIDDSPKREIYQKIGEMQLQAWEKCQGWIYWSYKLHTSGRNDWDFCRAVDEGWLVL